MKKTDDPVEEIRKNREAAYKKCGYDLHKYCEYVSKKAEYFKNEKSKKSSKHVTKKAA